MILASHSIDMWEISCAHSTTLTIIVVIIVDSHVVVASVIISSVVMLILLHSAAHFIALFLQHLGQALQRVFILG